MKAREEPQLKTLPVTLLKRRKHTNRDVFKAQRERAEQIRKRAKTRRSEIKRPAFFIAASRKRRRDEMRLKRVFKRKKPCMAADANRLGLIVRIKREEEEISKECLEILHLLRLDTYNLAVFVKVNQPMLELLSFIEPYIAWGYPSLQTVRDLLFKRGRTLIGRRSQSVDNQLIESRLDCIYKAHLFV
ncbi:unnamed protein product [Dicrocoelium dendriticum]|nr:unnamed protein product [Dicrocoelium dendriticum]